MDPPPRVERSPADLLRLVVAAIGLLALSLVEYLFGDSLVEFGEDLLRGLDAVPEKLVDALVLATRVLGLVVLGSALAYMVVGRRWRMLTAVAGAAALASAVLPLLDAIVPSDEVPALAPVSIDLGVLTDDGAAAAVMVAVVSAALTAAAPWVSRRGRRAGWAMVVGLMLCTFVSSPLSFDAALAILTGWFCGAAMLVILGAPSRRPSPTAVAEGLAVVGVPIAQLEPASVDARGSTPYFATDTSGEKLFVKALGEDERSADLLFRLYRRLQPHDLGDERAFISLRRTVEHEALVALAVRNLGVRTPRLRAVAEARPNGHALAYEAIAGRSLDKVEGAHVTDEMLRALWDLVGVLRTHRIAHRDLRLANMFLHDRGDVWLIDFGFGELTASDLLMATDVAELTASSSVSVGADRAVRHAVRTVDAATLARALDRLHPWALSGATRSALKARPGLLDSVRHNLAEAVMARDAATASVGPHPPASAGNRS